MASQPFSDNSLRLSPVTAHDHAGYIWIVTILSLIYSSLATIIRIGVNFCIYGVDDFLLFFAMLVHIGQASSIFYGLKHGLARVNSITAKEQWSYSGEAFFVSELLTIAIICLAECSTVTLILRIFTADAVKGKRWITCCALLGLSAAWGIDSILGLSVKCNASTILTAESPVQCQNQFLRWQVVSAIDMIIDIFTALLPAVLIWPLNMRRDLKLQVVVAFMFRLPLIVLSAIHLHYLQAYLPTRRGAAARRHGQRCPTTNHHHLGHRLSDNTESEGFYEGIPHGVGQHTIWECRSELFLCLASNWRLSRRYKGVLESRRWATRRRCLRPRLRRQGATPSRDRQAPPVSTGHMYA